MARRELLRIYRLASGQFGVFARAQALALGMSPSAVDRFVRSGAWIRVRPGVYRIAAVPFTWESDLMAAWLWAGDGALVSHRSAGRVWGLDGVPNGLPELCVPTARRGEDVILHRLQPEDRPRSRMLKGFRATSIERTMLDLCAVSRPSVAGLALDDALRKRLTTLARVGRYRAEITNCGRDGTRLLGALLSARDERDAATANRFEKMLLRICKRIDDRRLVTQCRVDDGSKTYYLDLAFPEVKLGIEGHSLRWHLGEEKWKKDVRRDRRLSVLGWEVLYFPWEDVRFAPDLVEAEIRDVLTRLSSTRASLSGS